MFRIRIFRNSSLVAPVVVGVLFFIADQLFKNFVQQKLHNREVFLIDDFLSLAFVQNNSFVFGLQFPQWLDFLLVGSLLAAVFFFLIQSVRRGNIFLFWMQAMILSGGLSNLFDRVSRGFVVDYFSVPFWSVFNLADAEVVGGVIGWGVYFFLVLQKCVAKPEKNIPPTTSPLSS